VLDHVRRGELADLEEIREIADAIAAVEELEQRLDDREQPTRPLRPAARRETTRDGDDGTVSSRSWSPPRPAASSAGRVWRPVTPAPTHIDEARHDAADADDEPGSRFREDRRPRAGGITFERRDETGPDPDDDLAEYMNPDDVPPKKQG